MVLHKPEAGPGTRRLLLVHGDAAWAERWVLDQLGAAERAATLWVAERVAGELQPTPAAQLGQRLGGEYRLLVFNAHQGLHPDAFAAAVGTLCGGGDFALLLPRLPDWATYPDPDRARLAAYPHTPEQMGCAFLKRLRRCWNDHPAVRVVTPETPLALRLAPASSQPLALSDEQTAALAAVERVARGHARRPLVLTADRGRGKSTVLGIAAARLLLGGWSRVTVVAPHRAAAETLLRHALAEAGVSGPFADALDIGGGQLMFRLPADCLELESPGLVLVDEAAAIPVAVLAGLLLHSNRLVFASTVHGYEGSGRGFELRFRDLLTRRMPRWRALRLIAPVRWSVDDPLEDLVNRSLLLDVQLPELDQRAQGTTPVIIKIDRADLSNGEPLLRALFGLLVNAHYQTRPSDLRALLDCPDRHLWLALADDAVVGVLLTVVEGGFDTDMAHEIMQARRRPRGHLLPQSLAVHADLEDILQRRVLRVQRIAVHPALRRRGLGTHLVAQCAGWAEDQGFDVLGCAFAADRALLGFWRALDFVSVHMGARIDPASAAHSLFMLRGLSGAGAALSSVANAGFLTGLPWSLGVSLQNLDSELAVVLLHGRPCRDLALGDGERQGLQRIASALRRPAGVEAAVWKALVRLAAHDAAPPEQLAPLIARWLQHLTPDQVGRRYGIVGRRGMESRLCELLRDQAALLGFGQ